MRSRNVFSIFVIAILFSWLSMNSIAAEEQPKANADAKEAEKGPKAGRKPASEQGDAEDTVKKEDVARKPNFKALPLSEIGLLELEARNRQLEDKARKLDERQRAIEVQERILGNKMKRIEEISEKMAERLETFKKVSQGKIKKLVTVIESMKADAAARYFESVDPHLAVEVLTRIDVKRAAKILNKVDKDRSARLTELYTGYRSTVKPIKKEGKSAG